MAQHYYEYIDESTTGGGKIRRYYGKLIPGNNSNRISHVKVNDAPLKGDFNYRYNYVELLTADMNEYGNLGLYKTEYYDANNSLVKEFSSEYEYSVFDENIISTNEQLFSSTQYHPWGWFFIGSAPAALNKQGGANYNPSNPPEYPFYKVPVGTGNPIITLALGYGLNFPADNVIESNKLALNPFALTGVSCGLYSNVPGWATAIGQTNQPWTSYHSASTMASRMQDEVVSHLKTYISGEFFNPLPKVAMFHFLKDNIYKVPVRSIKTQQSSTLRPKKTITINKY
jgi:hypothetical protein